MRVNIVVHKSETVEEGETIEHIVEKCGYPIESVILLKQGEIIIEEDVQDLDTIELIPVASGG